MPVPNLEVASAVSDGLARHHLRDDARATDVVQTARDLIGLHATGAPNPGCSCGRVSGFERSMLRDRPVAGWRDARHTYRGFAEAPPDVRLDSCRVEATVLLVERYVARYGPVTLDDVAWWTGLGVGRCRTAYDELGDRIAPVRVRGWDGDHFVLRADLDRLLHASGSRGPQLSLLAAGSVHHGLSGARPVAGRHTAQLRLRPQRQRD